MDLLVGFGIFSVGVSVGWFVRGLVVHPVVITKTAVPTPGPDGCYARFHFADARVEVRKFRATDLNPTMEWRGRQFQAGEWTADGQVYHEVLSGR